MVPVVIPFPIKSVNFFVKHSIGTCFALLLFLDIVSQGFGAVSHETCVEISNGQQCNNSLCINTHTRARTRTRTCTHTHTHTHTTWVGRYQKGKTNLDFTEARDGEWQWHQLGHMQVCTSLKADNHASTTPLSFLQARCPSCHPTNSVTVHKTQHNTYVFSTMQPPHAALSKNKRYSWYVIAKYQWLSPESHNIFKVTTWIQLKKVPPFCPVQWQTTIFVNSSHHNKKPKPQNANIKLKKARQS